jgi:hypothetical protein
MSDADDLPNLTRDGRVEARQFARLFNTPDGKAVLANLKRDLGWDCAAPVPDKNGEISVSRLRAWTGSRGVIALIIHQIAIGVRISENQPTNHQDD